MSRKGSISRDVAFRTLTEIRRGRVEAQMEYGIFSFTKSGELAKRPSALARTKKEAEETAEYMSRVNNKPFVVRKL